MAKFLKLFKPSSRSSFTAVRSLLDRLPRRVVAKVEWHQGKLFPRVGFIVTNLSNPPKGIVRFYNGRGTAEQWIKEGKYALNWTRLSCHKFVANQVRLWLFVRGSEGENRGRIPVADAQADGYQTAFVQFDPSTLNSYLPADGIDCSQTPAPPSKPAGPPLRHRALGAPRISRRGRRL